MTRIAIIGAGMAGTVLARELQDVAEVVLFEKSTGVGGRMATRRREHFHFDHGAQFFTARHEGFSAWLAPYIANGIVTPWEPRVLTLAEGEKPYRRDWFELHYVATPTMTRLCKAVARHIDTRLGTRVEQLQSGPGGWQLAGADGALDAPFDWVVSTAPPAQSAALLPAASPLQTALAGISPAPCLTLLLGLAADPALRFDAARCKHPVIDWIWTMQSKPGRPLRPAMVVHATPGYSQQHFEADDAQISAQMLAAVEALTGIALPTPIVREVKRWRYATAQPQPDPLLLMDSEQRLACCGDWTDDGRIEAAFVSARRLAAALKQVL